MATSVDPREIRLVAKIEERHRQPDLCTIYAPDDDEEARLSTWITAKEGSFVSLTAVR
ncbi:DUF7511 domain-containing protein [Halovenus marina]|uniref:DUF7511 domain-containing protein n=1 Tax=Halovenus marina TaxID=3396621 RepID=UPI003F546A2C